MANSRSAKKRINVIAKKTLRNKRVRTATRTAIKKANVALTGEDQAQAVESTRLAIKAIDQATAKGIFHKNTASRKKSQLAKKLAAAN
ncbi:MAG: 30S ribosomal protein S20 [Firmicutes bacterium]|nr:30S ribosomal protein S20 [Bacillota bacterium]